MAKKVVASLREGLGKNYTRVIKMVKNPANGTYSFKEDVVHNEEIKDFIK
jgi:hypothetical protein